MSLINKLSLRTFVRVLSISVVSAWLLSPIASAQLATPDENGLAFGHVHLNVPDIEEHLALWIEHFDGEFITVGSEVAVKFQNFIVMFEEQTPSLASVDTVMHHFGFKLRDIDKFITKWEDAGLEMGPIFPGAEGYTNAYVTLPGGVEVELQEDQSLHREFTGYHIHYSAEAYEELLNWYNTMFDLETQARGTIGSATNVPGMNMSFGQLGDRPFVLGDGPFAATQGTAIDHVGFEVENLEAFCRELEAKGIVFDKPYHWISELGVYSASFIDPKGVSVELTEGLGKL
ncbi:MAG: VOC family protein [Gammaproteobacteria bacterium]|nr:VOC family protein [Gammaproteobacteria bacterium]